MEKILRQDVSYDAIEETSNWRDLLKEALKENAEKIGLSNEEIDNLSVQESLHMTLQHYSPKSRKGELAEEKKEVQLTNFELGRPIFLEITDIGILRKDGEILNIAFKVDDYNFADQDLGTGRTLRELSINSTPHITYAIDSEKGAKAINSQKCFGDESVSSFEEGETFEVIKLDKPIELDGISVAHKFAIISTELEGFPRDFGRFSLEMTSEEIEESKVFMEECIDKNASCGFEF